MARSTAAPGSWTDPNGPGSARKARTRKNIRVEALHFTGSPEPVSYAPMESPVDDEEELFLELDGHLPYEEYDYLPDPFLLELLLED